LLALIHHAVHRLPDFVALFSSQPLPSLAREQKRLAAARAVAKSHPWSQLVLRYLELVQYRDLAEHKPGWIAERAKITLEQEDSTLRMLADAGQVEWSGSHWVPRSLPVLDLREEPQAVQRQRAFGASVASEHSPTNSDAVCAYNVCTVSAQGYKELKALQREYLQKARSLIAASAPQERVVLLQVNLLPFD
jgi:hypothetical protein